MVQTYRVHLVDDLSKEEIPEGEGESIRFSIDGQNRIIDLSTKNADKMRKAIQPFLAASRPFESSQGKAYGSSHRSKASVSSIGSAQERQQIREWAKGRGMRVSDRGRISEDIVEAWQAAQKAHAS